MLTLLTILLNSADTLFTSLALTQGVSEFNPIMAAVLNVGMGWFIFNKLVLINVLILFLGYSGRAFRIGQLGILVTTCTYTILAIYHLINLSLLTLTSN